MGEGGYNGGGKAERKEGLTVLHRLLVFGVALLDVETTLRSGGQEAGSGSEMAGIGSAHGQGERSRTERLAGVEQRRRRTRWGGMAGSSGQGKRRWTRERALHRRSKPIIIFWTLCRSTLHNTSNTRV